MYVSGLTNGDSLAELLVNLQGEDEEEIMDEIAYFHAHFNYHGKEKALSNDDFLLGVLSGCVGFITQSGYSFLTECREYPGRSPQEPDNEKVNRGT